MSDAYSAGYFKNFQYFFAVVEDREDPLKLGRVRIRAFGIHTEDRSKIPTKISFYKFLKLTKQLH